MGDIVQLKKRHPCGSYLWKVIRLGIDVRLECLGCGRMIVLERETALKDIKRVIERGKIE
ncbi:MAG: DUF951 domain-containing protein [bacterium]